MRTLNPPFLLVAMPQLQDPNFQKAVVLVVEHSEEGALGFIINRPSTMAVNDLIVSSPLTIPKNIPAWIGGPVGTDNGIVLHNVFEDADGTVYNDKFVVSSSDGALKGLVDHAQDFAEKAENFAVKTFDVDCLYPFRFLIGYAGWASHQLADEIRHGSWLQLPYEDELVFNTPWIKVWDTCMRVAGVNPMNIAPALQPYLN